MKEKLCQPRTLFVISLLLGIMVVWHHFFGFTFLGNRASDLVIPVESLQCNGYEVVNGGFTSTKPDPQMQVALDGKAYRYVYIDIANVLAQKEVELQVFYTEDGTYSEENSVLTTVQTGTNCIRFPRAIKLKALRIDIGVDAGISFQLKEIICSNKNEITLQFWVCLVAAEIFIGLCWILVLRRKRIMNYVWTHKWEVAIVCIAFGLYYLWSLVLPYNTGPDEYMRYDVARYIQKFQSLPRGDDPFLCDNVWGISYAYLPYLSYLISGILMILADAVGASEFELLHVARFASVVFSIITLIYCVKIAKEILDEKSGRLFVVMVGFLPQFAFISGYVNNDSLAIMSTAMAVYYWIRGCKTKWELKTYVGLGVALAICVASYRNAYGYGVCSALLFVCYYLVQYKKTKDVQVLKEMVKKGLIICGIVALLSGWWFVRNYILYDGDIMGTKIAKIAKEKYAAEEFKPGVRKTISQQGISLRQMLFDMGWIKSSMRSFVAAFGYMEIWLSTRLYGAYFLIFGVGILGHVCAWWKKKSTIFNRLLLVNMWLAMGIVLFLSVYYSYFKDYQAQGRYLLPAIVPLMMLLSTGIVRFEEVISEKARRHIPIVNIVIAFFVIVGVLVLTNKIIPTYYWGNKMIPELFWK